MIINYEGQDIEITNWEEFQEKLLLAIGFQIQSEVIKQINELELVDTGFLKNSIHVGIAKDGSLEIVNTAPYAIYLEYGTFDYFKSFGLNKYPEIPDPKKRNLSRKDRKKLRKGMQPFAPFRRVMYNDQKMAQIVERAVKSASK